MSEPTWLKTISNHAVISRSELLEWLGVDQRQLTLMLRRQGFPRPRISNSMTGPIGGRVTSTSRWRVGDVRAWLAQSPALSDEVSTPLGSHSSQSIKTLRAAGYDGMGKFVGKH
jgi:carbamoylphosphate synthase small subunit